MGGCGVRRAPALCLCGSNALYGRTVTAPRRVLIVDDHSAVREGLRSLIATIDELELVGEAADGAAAMRLARAHRPELVVLDHNLKGESGIELIADLRQAIPAARIVMFSLDASVRELAIAAGADAYVSKDASIGEILAALRIPG